MSSKLFFINHNKLLFSTYTNKNVVIGTPHFTKMETLKGIIDTHKKHYNKWLNKCVKFYDFESSKVIKLGANSGKLMRDDILTEICHLDMNDP